MKKNILTTILGLFLFGAVAQEANPPKPFYLHTQVQGLAMVSGTAIYPVARLSVGGGAHLKGKYDCGIGAKALFDFGKTNQIGLAFTSDFLAGKKNAKFILGEDIGYGLLYALKPVSIAHSILFNTNMGVAIGVGKKKDSQLTITFPIGFNTVVSPSFDFIVHTGIGIGLRY